MRSILSRAAREPLLHFVLLAGALFLGAAALSPDGDVIEVSRAELDWRILQVEASEGPLTPEERRLVEEAYIDERVLIREAKANGLDQDARIDDILVQKMLHVLSGEVIQPAEEELVAYYEANRERYATPPSITVEERVLAPEAPRPSESEVDGAGGGAEAISERVMERMTSDDLAQIFGEQAAAEAFSAAGTWVDAGVMARGRHWLRVRERFDAGVPPFDVVRDFVRRDWIAEREQARLLELVAQLRERYTIVVEGREEER
ncbi:MAG TPA: peptidylprolyl isomerase [Longimicrobiales bacterium]|nr:peptidylprolyl isomerase [Longimicrobiales bacterium]